MSKNPKTQYKIRNEQNTIVGTYAEEDIVSRIAAGKYKGIEEVSVEPYVNWQKLGSHPAFYDAFLRRLFVSEYQAVAKEDGVANNNEKKGPIKSLGSGINSASSKAEIKNNLKSFEVENDKAQATQQLLTERNNAQEELSAQHELEKLLLDNPVDGSVLKDPIEELELIFDQNDNQQSPPIEDPLKFELPKEETLSGIKLFTPLDTGVPAIEKKTKQRKKLIAASVGLGLGFLYLMGQSGPETLPVSVALEKGSSLGYTSGGYALTAINKEELISALIDEAAHFYDLDTPLHYEGALSLFKEASGLRPEDPALLAWVVSAEAHLWEGKLNDSKATAELTNLIEKGRVADPQLSAFYRAEALMAYAQKNFDVAVEKVGYATESDPLDLESGVLQAEFLNASGDTNQAKMVIENVILQRPTQVHAYFVAAQNALDMSDLVRAEERAKQALSINPMHANTHYVLAEIYQRKGSLGPAIAHFDLVTKLAPLATQSILADAHFSLGKLLEEQGNTAEAEKHNSLAFYFSKGLTPGLSKKVSNISLDDEKLKKLAQESSYGRIFYDSRAEELLSEGEWLRGLGYLQVARLLEPKDPDALVRVADVVEKRATSYKKLKRAEILYERAIEIDPFYLDSYIKLAEIESSQYNFDKAYQLLSRAAEVLGIEGLNSFVNNGCKGNFNHSNKAKDEYKVFLGLGKQFFKRENFPCTGAFLAYARSESPVNSDIFFYQAKLEEIYKKDAAQAAAISYYQSFTIDSGNYEALAGWARVKVKQGEKNYAIKFVRALLEAESQNAKLFWVLGEIYSENQEYQRSITFYKKALDYNSQFSGARISMARSLSATGQNLQAIREFIFAAETDRRKVIGYFEAAQLQTINRRYQEAESLVSKLIQATPNFPGAHRLLSQIYQFSAKNTEAIAEMVTEVENNPQNTKFLIELGELYMKYQKQQEAIVVLAKVTHLPDEKLAPEFRVERTKAFLLLSRCYRFLKRPDNAESAIHLALEIDYNDPELHRELGYVFNDLQRYREGVKEFEIYLERNPAGVDAENIKKLIKVMVIED
ncbi:MAG: tetratricopeptide repeat protein [Bdellovibrionales bacterium]|nr:tetratricopeptide repeat protein [Bdellovibrionales bacterium]